MNFKISLASFVTIFTASILWLQNPNKIQPPVKLSDSVAVVFSSPKNPTPPNLPKKNAPTLKLQSNMPLRNKTISEESNQADKLLNNWNLADTGLTRNELAPFFTESQPESIVYFSDEGMKRIYPLRQEMGEAQSAQTLFIASAKEVKKVAQEREDRAAANASLSRPHTPEDHLRRLPRNSYEIVFFKAGKRDKGGTLVPTATDFLAAIQGPDYDLNPYNWENEELKRAHDSKVLSFGHGGELMLKVKNNGFLLDEPGFDFVAFENGFRTDVDVTPNIALEFGTIGVSESADPLSFHWFACDPKNGVLRGCFGAVPTIEGGDKFDLAELGLRQIRYIWIKDLGINKTIYNQAGKWPTEGCDLDALRFDHAYTEN